MHGSGLPNTWIDGWLESEPSEGHTFECVHHRERDAFSDHAAHIAQMIREAKSKPERLERLLNRVAWLNPSRLHRPKTVQMRHGDFGEVVAIGLIEWSTELLIPIIKLRYQVDKDQSQHGTDIVAFLFDDHTGEIEDLEFCEVKVRSSGKSNAKNAALEAHSQLRDDRALSFADILEFLSQRLDEEDPGLSEKFDSYLGSRNGPDGRDRIVIVIDRDDYTDDILNNIPSPPDQCDPLSIDIVHCQALSAVISNTWDLVPPEVVQLGGNSGGEEAK